MKAITYLSKWLKFNHPDIKCGLGYEATRSFIYCWWERKMVQVPWKANKLIKVNIHFSYNPGFAFLGIYPRKVKICPHKNLYTNVLSKFIPNSQKLETTKISYKKVKQTVLYPYHEILLRNKKEWTTDTHNNLDGFYGEWETKNNFKKCILYNFIYITLLKWQNYSNGE